jgi:formyl-CoA transferase
MERFAGSGSVRWAGPALGEHNEDVLKKLLGMSEDKMQLLYEAGVI